MEIGMMRENFKRFLKMWNISPMLAYRRTLSKTRTCPARYRTVGKYEINL